MMYSEAFFVSFRYFLISSLVKAFARENIFLARVTFVNFDKATEQPILEVTENLSFLPGWFFSNSITRNITESYWASETEGLSLM